jgi:hypothetical protein
MTEEDIETSAHVYTEAKNLKLWQISAQTAK